MDDEQVRPRFGHVKRADGSTEPLVFYPTSDPDIFEALHPGTEKTLVVGKGDTLQIDVLGPGQTIKFAQGDAHWVKNDTGRLAGPTKEAPVNDETKPKDPNGWWRGLVMLAGLGVIIVLTVAGINWAMSL